MSKVKGSNAERELVHQFWKAGWAASRIAGSGSISIPAPDVIVGNPHKTIVFECKVSKANIQYFSQQEIVHLKHYALRMNAEPWVAVKFNRESWYFCPVDDLEDTGLAHKFSRVRARSLAFSFDDLTGSH